MENETKKESFDAWCLVELFGHQRIVGKVTEATLAGGAFLRVDVPAVDENKPFTRFYGPSAIYAISPVTEEIAMGMIRQYRHEPVQRFEFPQLAEKAEKDLQDHEEPTSGDDSQQF